MAGGDYTYAQGLVIDPISSELVQSGSGVFKDAADGVEQDIFDLVGTPIIGIEVGPLGVHVSFKADISRGVLNFGSVDLPVVSLEAIDAGLKAAAAQTAAENALNLTRTYTYDMQSASDSALAAQQARDAAIVARDGATAAVQPALTAAAAATAEAQAARTEVAGAVQTVAQSFSPHHQNQARANIGAGGRATTESRPAPSAAGEGAMVYDITLSKPIWSDGTNWRDAAGAVV